jgi:hypothetical protein
VLFNIIFFFACVVFSTRMLQIHLGDTAHILTHEDMIEIGKKTEGFSGDDMRYAFVCFACLLVIFSLVQQE